MLGMNRGFALVLTSVALAGTALGAPAWAQKAANTIRFAYDQAPESVDPFFNNTRIGVIIGANVWDTLVYRDPDTNEYKGQLATSWKQVDDRTIVSGDINGDKIADFRIELVGLKALVAADLIL